MDMKTETIKSYLKILLSLIKLENKMSLIQALKINIVWKVTRLQERKDYKSLSEGEGELSWSWSLNLRIEP